MGDTTESTSSESGSTSALTHDLAGQEAPPSPPVAPPSAPGPTRSITDLELSFAQNPKSDVFVELCEAYLAKRRFMEAMVVCKKAARTRPEALSPKLQLARVHEAQGRLPRAKDVVDGLLAEHPDDPSVLTAAGRLALARGEEAEGIESLKKALDVAPNQAEAQVLLRARGIEYPEIPALEANPALEAVPVTVPPTGAGPTASMPPMVSPPDASGVYRIAPQRLEGEDELERLAAKVADERPKRGTPKTTLLLLAGLVVMALAVVGLRLRNKAKVEAIDTLSKEAVTAFDRDLYASYKVAAGALEEILNGFDADHGKTLARLSHTYAILLTEHLETNVETRLREVLAQAEEHAPDEAHTLAARGLLTLYEGDDHAASAEKAVAYLFPKASVGSEAIPTFVDLALGVAELDAGDVDAAHKRLGRVAEFMRSNVRARVWSARAAASAGRLASAQRFFIQAQKAEPRHPGAIAGLALATLAKGDLAGAQAALDRFQALESEGSRDISSRDRALATFARSELHRRAGETAAADVEYEEAARLDPENSDFPFQRGRGLLDRDRLDDAVEYLNKAVAMEPNRWTYRVQLAEALMLSKKLPEAKKHLDFALAKAPGELEVALAQGRYLRRSQAPDAETYLTEKLPEKFPSAKVELALERGRYFRSQGDLEKAEAELSTAVEAFGGRSQALQGDVLVSFGLVAQERGNRPEAVKAYKEAARRGNLDALALLALTLQGGSSAEREEALAAGRRYLAAGKALRRTELVEGIVQRLEGGS